MVLSMLGGYCALRWAASAVGCVSGSLLYDISKVAQITDWRSDCRMDKYANTKIIHLDP